MKTNTRTHTHAGEWRVGKWSWAMCLYNTDFQSRYDGRRVIAKCAFIIIIMITTNTFLLLLSMACVCVQYIFVRYTASEVNRQHKIRRAEKTNFKIDQNIFETKCSAKRNQIRSPTLWIIRVYLYQNKMPMNFELHFVFGVVFDYFDHQWKASRWTWAWK